MPLFLQACPQLGNDVSVLATYLVESAAAGRTEGFVPVFEVMERMPKVDPELFLPWLGPQGRRGWVRNLRSWHGTSGKGWPGRMGVT
jgi:hypothetical protein